MTGDIAFEERGEGAAVILVHGIASERSVWREVMERLTGVRAIAYDRRAYGQSTAPEPYGGTTVGEQADDLAELIRTTRAAPATLCGYGFGALVCLDVLVRFPELGGGAVLIEPPMLWLSQAGSEVMSEVRAAVEEGAREGGGAGAVEAYLGEEALALMGEERSEAARAAVQGFAADLAAAASWAGGRRELRGIEQPVIVITGTHSTPVNGQVAGAVAELIPNSELVELDSGHYAQLEQPDEVAAAIMRIASA